MKWRAYVWLIALALILVAAEALVWQHAYATCDGVVVRNAWDWPACVAGGRRK